MDHAIQTVSRTASGCVCVCTLCVYTCVCHGQVHPILRDRRAFVKHCRLERMRRRRRVQRPLSPSVAQTDWTERVFGAQFAAEQIGEEEEKKEEEEKEQEEQQQPQQQQQTRGEDPVFLSRDGLGKPMSGAVLCCACVCVCP